MNGPVKCFSMGLFLFSFLTISGCLDFGDDIELSGEAVDSTVIAKVTKITGVVFPTGTKGKNYMYFGSGIDPALVLKVSIPKEDKDEFLKNTIFVSGEAKEPSTHLGQGKSWYNVKSLIDPVHTIYTFPNGHWIQCSVGAESGETVVYLSWITM